MLAQALKAVLVTLGLMLTIWGMISAVRWAKRGGTGAAALSILLMLFGGGVLPPQQTIEEAREGKGKKGSEGHGRDAELEE